MEEICMVKALFPHNKTTDATESVKISQFSDEEPTARYDAGLR